MSASRIPASTPDHFDWVAQNDTRARRAQRGFHRQILRLYQQRIPAGGSVLEWGCGRGDLLAALKPAKGTGCDFSRGMIRAAGERADGTLAFHQGDILKSPFAGEFDHIVLDYLLGYLPDVQQALENLQASAHPRTRLHLTTLNNLWEAPLRLAQKAGLVTPQPLSNWLSHGDIVNLLELAGWEAVRVEHAQLLPLEIPLLSFLCNRILVRLPLIRHLGATIVITARPVRKPDLPGDVGCSVIVPARNEAGNIAAALRRIPVLGKRTEIIFVEGNSLDDTWGTIQREVAAYAGPHLVKAIRQPGRGKWDAVRAGMEIATGDVLVVQDADLTAPPEDLPKFFSCISSGRAEFANGSRLVYPMEKQAMRFLNLIGNKFFALSLSYVLGQTVKDSLCGTKMIMRKDCAALLARMKRFGDFDPFGDFNLLFGASLLNLRIRDIPVRYKDRSYGETNISRFSHGWLLLKMTWFGFWRIKMAE